MLTSIDVNSLTTIAECIEIEKQALQQKDSVLARAARERKYQISISNLKTQKECDNFISNAKKNQRDDLVILINQKSIDISLNDYLKNNHAEPIETECLKVLFAYEKHLSINNSKKTHATYTWRAIKQNGILPAIDLIVSQNKDALGFSSLKKSGLIDDTFEKIVMKYPSKFSTKAFEKSTQRLTC